MAIGILTGSGTYALPGLESSGPLPVYTPWGEVLMSRGTWSGVEVLHISRHGPGHPRLSNQVTHRANIAALKSEGAEGVLAVTVCGAVDPDAELGTLVCFDDLHFLSNRLPDGSLCTFFNEPGAAERGHWIYEGPFSSDLRRALLAGAADAEVPVRDGGCYGHVDGPRFNTASEIRSLAAAGVTAVSQTAGPETVLSGELELPYALLGFLTDYANGVQDEATPVDQLVENMAKSGDAFAAVLRAALSHVSAPKPPGVVYRFAASD
jgi:purine nucleoside phosphorylase